MDRCKTPRERPCGSRGRGWRDTATSQGTPRTAWSHQKLGQQGRTLPQRRQREPGPAGPWSSDFWPPEDEGIKGCDRHPPAGGTRHRHPGKCTQAPRHSVVTPEVKLPHTVPSTRKTLSAWWHNEPWAEPRFCPGMSAPRGHRISFSPFLHVVSPPSLVAELTCQ